MEHEARIDDGHVATNFELLTSCYLAGSKELPGDAAKYYYADLIKSTNWNHAVFANPLDERHRQFVREAASESGVNPAFFVREEEIDTISSSLGNSVEIDRERWMLASKSSFLSNRLLAVEGVEVELFQDETPVQDYFDVLANLFGDDSINAIFRDKFIPTMRSARLGTGVHSIHAIAYRGGRAVGCGSTFRKGQLAGLYNVGTRHSEQSKGIGAMLSQHLSNATFEAGANEIFLQCVIGTHVEKLYSGLGYQSAEMPGIVIFK